jgi:acid phosphatase
MLERFRSTYLGSIGDRLEQQNPHMRFHDSEIYSMQEMCGFEMTVRGSSKWCDVFTHADWLSFEYARDVVHYYRSGWVHFLSRRLGVDFEGRRNKQTTNTPDIDVDQGIHGGPSWDGFG